MATYTPNLNLKKPSTGEYYDMVADLNDAKDKIDGTISNVSIDKYKSLFVGNDITLALKQAIIDSPKGATIKFNPASEYELSDTIILAKPLIIDFNNAPMKIKINGKVAFELQHSGEINYHNRIKLINYTFKTVEGFIPTSIIYVNGAINSVLKGSFDDCTASHSLIWNYKGYHTSMHGESRWADCPRVIYLSNSSGAVHSFAFDINMDITGNTGKGIETEGANGQILGVVESCQGGGYEYNGIHNATGINVAVHFENNSLFDMKIGGAAHVSSGATNSGIHNIIGSLFSRTINDSIFYGSGQMITIIGCQLNSTAKPIDGNVIKTTINTLANLGVYDEVLTAEMVKLNYSLNQWGVHKINEIETKKLTTNAVKQSGEDSFILYLKNAMDLIFSETALKPSKSGYSIGGRWNMFKRVYAENTYLRSPNGKVWQLNISNTGVITAYEEV